jgi:hypothetical protein
MPQVDHWHIGKDRMGLSPVIVVPEKAADCVAPALEFAVQLQRQIKLTWHWHSQGPKGGMEVVAAFF